LRLSAAHPPHFDLAAARRPPSAGQGGLPYRWLIGAVPRRRHAWGLAASCLGLSRGDGPAVAEPRV